MSGLFSKPKIPKPPAVPTRDAAKEAQQERDRMNLRRGTAANILTSPLGDPNITTASKVLLGK